MEFKYWFVNKSEGLKGRYNKLKDVKERSEELTNKLYRMGMRHDQVSISSLKGMQRFANKLGKGKV